MRKRYDAHGICEQATQKGPAGENQGQAEPHPAQRRPGGAGPERRPHRLRIGGPDRTVQEDDRRREDQPAGDVRGVPGRPAAGDRLRAGRRGRRHGLHPCRPDRVPPVVHRSRRGRRPGLDRKPGIPGRLPGRFGSADAEIRFNTICSRWRSLRSAWSALRRSGRLRCIGRYRIAGVAVGARPIAGLASGYDVSCMTLIAASNVQSSSRASLAPTDHFLL
ncbi:hypothetical protein EMIT0373P_60228 [Pseudomonas chlororaphis]